MASKTTKAQTNGHAKRKLQSWIGAFVDHTSYLESAPIWRRWAAISTIASALEQRVWVDTGTPFYPNLYIFLVGHAGLGKSRTISAASKLLREMPEPFIGPTSVTLASLVDCLVECKRTLVRLPDPPHEYNTVTLIADELSAFLPLYEPELIGGLTTFYDCVPYSQHRRGKDIRIRFESPQVNMLTGSTPSNLIKFVPESAWEQGFMSRVIMVYSEDHEILDIFNMPSPAPPKDLLHDLRCISSLFGEFQWTPSFATVVHGWRVSGQPPTPQHPKLVHYNSRRLGHVLKLSMVSAVDRGDLLRLEDVDFNRALDWLVEAELYMPEIFRTGAIGADAKAMDEIYDYIGEDKEMPETRICNFARKLIPAHSVARAIEIMERSGMIKCVGMGKNGVRTFRALARQD